MEVSFVGYYALLPLIDMEVVGFSSYFNKLHFDVSKCSCLVESRLATWIYICCVRGGIGLFLEDEGASLQSVPKTKVVNFVF